MALTILVAGISKDERARVEGAVKSSLGWRALSEDWTVSLVRVGSQWSVTLSGPGEQFRNLSFVCNESQLADKIAGAVGSDPGGSAYSTAPGPMAAAPAPTAAAPTAPWAAARAPAAAPAAPWAAPRTPAAAPTPRATPAPPPPSAPKAASPGPGGRQTCRDCGQGFIVHYESRAGEPLVVAAVACPHCWKINHIEIGSWAAAGRDYRAEKA